MAQLEHPGQGCPSRLVKNQSGFCMRDSVVISLIIEIDLYTHNSRDRPVWKSGEPAALYGACANELVSGLSPQEIRGCIWLYVGGGGGHLAGSRLGWQWRAGQPGVLCGYAEAGAHFSAATVLLRKAPNLQAGSRADLYSGCTDCTAAS